MQVDATESKSWQRIAYRKHTLRFEETNLWAKQGVRENGKS